jgi:hypothetical protein
MIYRSSLSFLGIHLESDWLGMLHSLFVDP